MVLRGGARRRERNGRCKTERRRTAPVKEAVFWFRSGDKSDLDEALVGFWPCPDLACTESREEDPAR